MPLTYDLMQTQLKRSGSLNQLAEEYTKSFLGKLSNVGSEALLHEQFDPIVNLEEITKKKAMKFLIFFKTKGKDISFEQLIAPLTTLVHEAMFAFYDEIIDGFKEGEVDLMKWVKANLIRIGTAGLEPNQMMMG